MATDTQQMDNKDIQSDTKENVMSVQPHYKHPLHNKWSFWFLRNDKNKTWADNLLEITTFDTVEDFWALYNHIELVSRIPQGCDYCVFKQGIKPMWEDDQNRQGGRWLHALSRNQRLNDLDNYWLELLLLLIGEGFSGYSDDICGAVVNVRPKADKISLWTTSWKKEDVNKNIGRIMKTRLRIAGPGNLISYQAHDDTSTKHSSTTKARYTV